MKCKLKKREKRKGADRFRGRNLNLVSTLTVVVIYCLEYKKKNNLGEKS